MVLGSSPVTVTSPSDFAPASSKEFLDIQATVECGFAYVTWQEHTVIDYGFTLKLVQYMIITQSQMYFTDKSSQHNLFGQFD